MSFKLLGVLCSVPPLTSHIEIYTASVSIGSNLGSALALQCLPPARACPIVHIHKTLAVNGTFQTIVEYQPHAIPRLILVKTFVRRCSMRLQLAGSSQSRVSPDRFRLQRSTSRLHVGCGSSDRAFGAPAPPDVGQILRPSEMTQWADFVAKVI